MPSSAETRSAEAGVGPARGNGFGSTAPFLILLAILCGTGCPVPTAAYPAAIAIARAFPADASVTPEPNGTDTSVQAPRLAVGEDGRVLGLTGDLTEGIADQVAAVLAAHPRIERLYLTSEGGLVNEALVLGRLVAAHALATYVPETCASACTLVFVRGRGRFLAEGARLGFHGPYETGFFEAVRQVDPALERRAYINAGLAPDFVARALAVRSDEMWTPDVPQLRAAGVVTEVVRRERFSESGSGPRVGSVEVQHRPSRSGTALARRGRSPKAGRSRDARAASGPRSPVGTGPAGAARAGQAR